MEAQQNLDHQQYQYFLFLIDGSNGLPKLKFVECTVFEIIEGRESAQPFVGGVGTKYLRTRRVERSQNNEVRKMFIYYKQPRGWTWHICKQGSAEYFWGFESRMSVFFG